MSSEARRQWTSNTLVAGYAVLVVCAVGALASVTAREHAAQAVTILGPVVVASTLRPVSRAVRRATGADHNPMDALVSVAASLAEVLDARDALDAAVKAIGMEAGAISAHILDGAGRVVASWGTSVPGAVTNDVAVRSHGVEIATLRVESLGDGLAVPDLVLRLVADQVAPAVSNMIMREELCRQLAEQRRLARELTEARRRIVELGDDERQSLERDLHDGAQQCLMALVLRLGLAARAPTRATPQRLDIDALFATARGQLVSASSGLASDELLATGLGEALRKAIDLTSHGLDVAIAASALPRLPSDVTRALYFSCLEAVQNATKHAAARRVTVTLRTGDAAVEFEVNDDGRGFDSGTIAEGFGLRSIRERVDALGGHVVVSSHAAGGTVVSGWLPLSETRSA